MLWNDGCPSAGTVIQGKLNMTPSLLNLDETGGKKLPLRRETDAASNRNLDTDRPYSRQNSCNWWCKVKLDGLL